MNTWSEFSLHARFSPSIWLQTCSINKRGGPEAPAEAPEVPGRAPDAQGRDADAAAGTLNLHFAMKIIMN